MGYSHGEKWSREKIKKWIFDSMVTLGVERMPTRSELFSIRPNNPLHNGIVRNGGYASWADELGLNLKDSETLSGWKYEKKALEFLKEKGFEVERMSTKSPYDLLINGNIKVDVKMGKAYMLRGSRVHTFGINKVNPTCDLYIIFAIDENDSIERIFIIPSHHLKQKTMSIGKNSSYNKYIDKWEYFNIYNNFFKKQCKL